MMIIMAVVEGWWLVDGDVTVDFSFPLLFFSFLPLQLSFIFLFLIFLVLSVLVVGHVMRTIVGCDWIESNKWLNWRTKSHEISYEITDDWANSGRIRVPLGCLRMPYYATNELVISSVFFSLLNAFPDMIFRYLIISLFVHVCRDFFLVCFWLESHWLTFIWGWFCWFNHHEIEIKTGTMDQWW